MSTERIESWLQEFWPEMYCEMTVLEKTARDAEGLGLTGGYSCSFFGAGGWVTGRNSLLDAVGLKHLVDIPVEL